MVFIVPVNSPPALKYISGKCNVKYVWVELLIFSYEISQSSHNGGQGTHAYASYLNQRGEVELTYVIMNELKVIVDMETYLQ